MVLQATWPSPSTFERILLLHQGGSLEIRQAETIIIHEYYFGTILAYSTTSSTMVGCYDKMDGSESHLVHQNSNLKTRGRFASITTGGSFITNSYAGAHSGNTPLSSFSFSFPQNLICIVRLQFAYILIFCLLALH